MVDGARTTGSAVMIFSGFGFWWKVWSDCMFFVGICLSGFWISCVFLPAGRMQAAGLANGLPPEVYMVSCGVSFGNFRVLLGERTLWDGVWGSLLTAFCLCGCGYGYRKGCGIRGTVGVEEDIWMKGGLGYFDMWDKYVLGRVRFWVR